MGFFKSIFGGIYSISNKDRYAMEAKRGFVRYAFRYLGGHGAYPSPVDCVAELSKATEEEAILHVYVNGSPAGFSPVPKRFMFSIPIPEVSAVRHENKGEISGGVLLGGLGAILKETRFIIAIEYEDEEGFQRTVRFGSTQVVKSESYFSEFSRHLNKCMEQHNTRAKSSGKEKKEDIDFAAQLERLAALRDQGALTDEEFAKAKQRLLDQDGE